MKPFKIDRYTPIPDGMHRVHIHGFYMAYPKKAPRKKAPPKAPKLSKNVTMRKKKAAPSKKFDIDFGKKKGF